MWNNEQLQLTYVWRNEDGSPGQGWNWGTYWGAEDRLIGAAWWRRECWLKFNYNSFQLYFDYRWGKITGNGGAWLGGTWQYELKEVMEISQATDPKWVRYPVRHVLAGCGSVRLATIDPGWGYTWNTQRSQCYQRHLPNGRPPGSLDLKNHTRSPGTACIGLNTTTTSPHECSCDPGADCE